MHITIEIFGNRKREILKSLSKGEEVILTSQGKPYAKIVSIKQLKDKSNELFGIWKDRDDLMDINSYMRRIRSGI